MQKFAFDNKVIVTSHPEAMRKLHAWRTDFDRILKRSASIAYGLDSPWDPGISFVFSREDASLSTIGAGALIELLSFRAVLLQRPVPSLPPWSQRDTLVLIPRSPP